MAETSDAYMIRKQGGQVEEMCYSRSPELSIHWDSGQPCLELPYRCHRWPATNGSSEHFQNLYRVDFQALASGSCPSCSTLSTILIDRLY